MFGPPLGGGGEVTSPELHSPICEVCGTAVNHHRHDGSVAASISGWEVLRAEGGANSITHRQRTGKWAHKACLDGSRFQGTFFGG